MNHILPAELHARLAAGELLQLIDVREPWEFSTARIEGAKLIPMGEIAARVGELDSGAETIVICHHGGRSLQIAAFLDRKGFSIVHNLTGGVDAWARSIDHSMPTY
jgi:rhodanese-related sulfurtransferase